MLSGLNALRTLGRAELLASPDDKILVSHGVYGPAQDSVHGPIQLTSDVEILGGFLGLPNGTVDPNNPDGSFDRTIISGGGSDRACEAIGSSSSSISDALLRGFLVEDGSANSGAGIYASFTSNVAIELVKFVDNKASLTSGNGGAAHLFPPNADIQFDRVTFRNNWAARGGAIYATGGVSTTNRVDLANCLFDGNGKFGALPTIEGGAVHFGLNDEIDAANCLFHDNRAETGGAIYIVAGQGSNNSNGNFRFRNTTISRNGITNGPIAGAGVHVTESGTFSGGEVLFANSILYGNTGGDDLYKDAGSKLVKLEYTDYGMLGANGIPGITLGAGNINNGDPLFLNPSAGNFRLGPGSPCIDAGLNGLEGQDDADIDDSGTTGENLPLDLALDARRMRVGIDMGAFEAPGEVPFE